MLTAERRRSIIQTLQREGKVLASELSKELNVSEDTIRRDLRELAAAGVLQRVHGGALPHSPTTASFTVRQQQASALAYFDVFWVLAVIMVVLVFAVLLMKRSVAEKGARIGGE